jgi:hypothetical protein
MQFDRAKLKTVILYTCSKCNPSMLGAVKLHKVLYFSDMLHYAHVGVPITGSTYRKMSFGPTCDQLLPVLREMSAEGGIKIQEADYFGYAKKEYIPQRQPDSERLSNSERYLLDEIIEFVCRNNSAKTISDFSHNRAWELAEFGAVLPYNSVFQLFPSQVSPETMEWAATEVKNIEAQKRGNRTVGGTAFRDFRNRVLETIRGK